jgi:hypothetical protein
MEGIIQEKQGEIEPRVLGGDGALITTGLVWF